MCLDEIGLLLEIYGKPRFRLLTPTLIAKTKDVVSKVNLAVHLIHK